MNTIVLCKLFFINYYKNDDMNKKSTQLFNDYFMYL